MAGMSDLDAFAPPAVETVTLGGVTHTFAPLTLARYAAGRRFGQRFATALVAEDIMAALDTSRSALMADFEAATGVPRQALEDADAAEVVQAFFVLSRALANFTVGPLTAALVAGGAPLRQAAAPDGASSSPGSSPAATA